MKLRIHVEGSETPVEQEVAPLRMIVELRPSDMPLRPDMIRSIETSDGERLYACVEASLESYGKGDDRVVLDLEVKK